MSDLSPQDDDFADAPKRHRSGLRRAGKFALWTFAGLCLLLAVAAAGAYMMVGRTMTAPDWVRQSVEDRLGQEVEGYSVSFGRIEMVVPKDLRPRLNIANVDLHDETGQLVVQLSSVDAEVEVISLLSGDVRAHRVALDGANLTLRRSQDGSVNLALADSSSQQNFASYGALLDQLDDLLLAPALDRLETIEATGLIVNYSDERAARSWTADGGRILVSKDDTQLQAHADIALLAGRDYVSTIEISFVKDIGLPGAEVALSVSDVAAEDIATQSPAFAFLSVLDAPISGSMRTQLTQNATLGPLHATLEIGSGALAPTDQTRPVKFTEAKTYFTYFPSEQKMDFAVASIDSDWGHLTSQGAAFLSQADGVDVIVGQFEFSEIGLNPYGIYDAPVGFDGGLLDFQLELDPFTFSIGQVQLARADQNFAATGKIMTDQSGWQVSSDVSVNKVNHQDLMALWPADLKPKTRKWMSENIFAGVYQNVNAALRARADVKPNFALGFEFQEAETRFMKTMPNITKGSGVGSLINNQFVVMLEEGRVAAETGGALDVAGTTIEIPDVTIKQGPINIGLESRSTITAALSLLDRPPFAFLTKAGLPVTLADGHTDVSAQIGFDIKPKVDVEDVNFDVSATLRSLRSDTLIKGRTLRASALNVQADNAGMVVRGDAQLGQIPASGAWRMAFGPQTGGKSNFEGTIELSQAFVDEFNIGLPKGTVRGRGKGQVAVELRRGEAPKFALQSDLNGLRLGLETLGWVKSANSRGSLEVTGALSTPPQINRLAIDAGGLKTTGTIKIANNGSLASARFDRVRLGGWLDAPVTLTGRGKNAPALIALGGGTADLRKATIRSNGQGGGGPLQINLNRLSISDTIDLTDFRGAFDGTNGLDGEFTARVNGGTPIRGAVVPRRGQMGVRIQSNNAGGALKSAGILNEGLGGTLDLSLLPTGAEGTYDGLLKVRDIGIKDAPALAALMSAASVVGLLEQMSGQGIKFTEIDADFRLSPSQAIIKSSSAVGPSMGVSLDGIYNFNQKSMDFQGVFSPIFILNGIGSFLTRKGEGLIGFNFNIKGSTDNPRATVNPLSILTPGMFREIFRRPPPKVSQ